VTAVRRGPMTWLVLAYQLPPRSPLTATIRRRLTAAGAVYPANAVAVLPASAADPAGELLCREMGTHCASQVH